MKKKLFFLALAALMAAALVPAAAAAGGAGMPFADVSANDWFYEDVAFAYEHELMRGTSDTAFSPGQPMTRAMFITVLAREKDVNTDPGETWYSAAVDWARSTGLSDGTGLTDSITRRQIATMLYRYAGIGADGWNGEAMAWAAEAGIMNDGRGEDTATRAEAAAALRRFFAAYNADSLLAAVLHDDGAKWVEDEASGKYFKEGSAADGVKAIIASGSCYINGYAIPASADRLAADYPDGYTVNGSPWMTQAEGGWKVDRKTYETYPDAALALLRTVRAGQESRLYDTNGDGYADRIEAQNVEALIVDSITDNGDGTRTVIRQEFVPDEGEKPFDGQRFTAGSGETVRAENLDSSLKSGDMALVWYGPDGWVADKAVEANGILVDGADHQYYQIDGVKYGDAMRFSRDNIVISNRCGEFANAHRYFGFMNNHDGLKVSLWIVPTADPANSGAPAGFTTGENAKTFLASAIDTAKGKLASVTVSADGSDVPENAKWVTQEVYDDLSAAIARAEETLASDTNSSVLDYQVYLLYLHLHGSQDDIGARFAGYDFPGFDNQLQDGTKKLNVLLHQAGDFDPASDTNDGVYISELTDKYFEGGVEAGMNALLEAGQVYINGIRISPEAETFYMNGMPAIWQKEDGHWTWQAHDKLNSDREEKIPHNGDYSYAFARRRFVLAVSALRGADTILWAEKGSDTVCRVDFYVKSGAQAERIIANDNGTTTVWGVPIDAASYNTDGGPNNVEPRTLPTANFDQAIKEGDTVLYWYDAEGWHMERCVPVQGTMSATDHFNMVVNGVTHSDALIVRYNMQAGSRPMQFITANNSLRLTDIPVTLWTTESGHVVGISRMEYAKQALQAAIDYVDAKLDGKEVIVSEDGLGVPAGAYWATRDNLDAYHTAYESAKAVLANPDSTNAQMDAATQALGAAFSGNERGQGGLKAAGA